ncbi:MAG: hypothetical protein ABI460_02860 [Caldimonas sp.]
MQQLQKRLASQGNMQLSLETQAVLDELLKVSGPIRDHRDKMLAHYSLDHATKPDALKLPDIYYKDVEDAMDLVGEYMNLIEQHYTEWTQGYEHFAWQDDGDSLVGMLRNGLRYQEMLASQEVAFGVQDKWSAA